MRGSQPVVQPWLTAASEQRDGISICGCDFILCQLPL